MSKKKQPEAVQSKPAEEETGGMALPVAEVEEAKPATPEQLALVLNLARQQMKLQLEVAKAEEELKLKYEALKKCAEVDVPNALREVNLTELPLGEGWTVKMKKLIAGGITEANKEKAHAWLEKTNNGGLIKHVITISFGRDEDSWAKKFMRDLAQRKKPLNAERKDAVNTTTLGAFIRKEIEKAQEAGKDPKEAIPFDLLGVFERTYAELVPPKKPKASM